MNREEAICLRVEGRKQGSVAVKVVYDRGKKDGELRQFFVTVFLFN